MQDGPFDNSAWSNTTSFCEGAEQYTLQLPFQISQTSPSTVRHPQHTLCVYPLGTIAAHSISTERECTKDTCSRGQYVFRSTAQRPPVCLQVSGQLAALSKLFGIGRELNGGDGLWCWCIYLLRHWEEAPPMFWLTGRRPALLCLTRSGWRRVCLLTQWDVHEDDRKTFP